MILCDIIKVVRPKLVPLSVKSQNVVFRPFPKFSLNTQDFYLHENPHNSSFIGYKETAEWVLAIFSNLQWVRNRLSKLNLNSIKFCKRNEMLPELFYTFYRILYKIEEFVKLCGENNYNAIS